MNTRNDEDIGHSLLMQQGINLGLHFHSYRIYDYTYL